jgi:hypothetical protein
MTATPDMTAAPASTAAGDRLPPRPYSLFSPSPAGRPGIRIEARPILDRCASVSTSEAS